MAEDPAATEAVDFAREILPILSDKCYVCHGPDAEQIGAIRLDSYESALQDLGGYQAINPGDPSSGAVLLRIVSQDDPMPPRDAEKQLSENEKNLIRRWVLQGGQYATHWSFIPPQKSAESVADANDASLAADREQPLPHRQPTAEAQRVAAMIDRFISQKMQRAGISFASVADRATLARRAALTLTGLPPRPQLLRDFMESKSSEAFQDLIQQLLDSPGFGEHQARYWLDAVRYGDTHGLHLDNRRGIYPYRDWVVRAFNQNLPLDQFLIWQIAGDLLPQPTLEQQVASGFIRLNPTTSEGGAIAEEFQAKNSFDRTETFGTVLLGMTLTCARCHTHKYDPITQQEYYQLFAFFNNTEEPALDGNKYAFGPTVLAPQDQEGWERWERLTSKQQNLLSAIGQLADKGDVVLPADWDMLSPREQLAAIASYQVELSNDKFRRKSGDLLPHLQSLEESFVTTLVAKELSEPRETRLLSRGEYDKPVGEPLRPDIPAILGSFSDELPRNRLGLATWLVSPDNPLTARVLVNRLWQQVFGYGLTRTPEDFGLQGQQPTHPELLDWLAVELQDSGWDLQHMLRSMLLSQTFQQSSSWRQDVDDPDNRLFARGPSYRLDAEVIRDTALWASSLLDPHMGGEGIKPYQPAGMWQALAHPASNTKLYVQDEGQRLYRKSLYIYWKRTSPHPMMTLFDAPDREYSCVRRSRTSTSLQSLALFNETQRIEMARKFAESLIAEHQQDAQRMSGMFQLLACRNPTQDEQQACLRLLASERERFRQNPDDASR
ncbi:MAG: PSD1 and planctomycete cytochrome C domain-containing protein [bacterium]|nr:PSD1 and planctomycete cytochrome C domain-containing protein [bacterium]